MAAAAVGGILLATITLYAVLGGADFGGGLWDLLAGGDRRGAPPRTLIDESITPVWEANHVWLIFGLVIFWTAFPRAFAAVMTTAALPLWLAVAGIVLRGAAFAFRHEARRLGLQRAAGATFAASSLLTPFFMGTVIGAIATGAVPATASYASLAAWTSPTAILAGFLFSLACGYLAAVYLTGEAQRRGDASLQAYFTRRAQAAAIIAGALSLAALGELHTSNPALYARLTGRALPFVIAAGACGLAVLTLLTIGRLYGVRIIAAAGVAAVIWGWGIAQYPVLLPGTPVTLTTAGAPHATLAAIIWLAVAAVLTVGPSYALLLTLQGRQVLRAGQPQGTGPVGPDTATSPAAGSSGQHRQSPPRPASGSRATTVGRAALARRRNR
jgi:cytochrome d ubiquinol oxidase subunit II